MPSRKPAAEPPGPRLTAELQYATRRPWAPTPAALRRWARAALAPGLATASKAIRAGLPGDEAALCIRIVGRAESRRLDRVYRGKDKPTNVLSFPASPEERADGGVLGDLVVCAPIVAAEAREQGKALAVHWAHMIVHGTLHLLGHDHERSRAAARRMERLEVEILRGLGYPDPYLDDEEV